ncbi:uncharacterized protein DUF1049 [Tepidamorphus gemmatus]|jgi:uncharacterized integral membrane protein|uniref:Uncharacterized protein DUF1049 n=1 Tax=Tepidamorphus gemmatus TaxID=747076 RepID=A0A4R3MBH4_9HYPH|nr:lipopolysaccharide assembly protein LapA domain-containing protein [Tepidamorphus gemmatus]TCT10686.1 uncharacterized protein DUF1049 [Tepidamorphus gemmatus]
MIHRLVQILITLPLAVLIIAFSVANRAPVRVSLDPFGSGDTALSVSVPLFLLVLGCLLVGVLVGGTAAWLSQGKWRRRARLSREEAARWRHRAGEADRKLPAAPGLPALRR